MADALRSDRDILISAARALGRVDLYGNRALTGLSLQQIEDMALALVILGLAPIPPLQLQAPDRIVFPRLKEF
ncbi:hypothetical protein MASR2M74_02820 [Paracoccaceae bacterium]